MAARELDGVGNLWKEREIKSVILCKPNRNLTKQ